MIGKQIKGKGFRGCLNYVFEKAGARKIGGNMFGETPRELATEFAEFRELRPRLNRVVYHAALSLFPGEQLDDYQWSDLARQYMKGMGFSHTKYVLVRHTDTEDREHVHIVASRVRMDGTVVSDSWDYKRSEVILRQLEAEYNLVAVPFSWETQRKQPTLLQLQQEERTGQVTVKPHLQDLIDRAKSLPSPDLFQQLQDAGIDAAVSYTDQGVGKGVSYALNGVACAGTDLGTGYTISGVSQGIPAEELRKSGQEVTAFKARLAQVISATANRVSTVSELVAQLAEQDIKAHVKFTRTGKVNGICYIAPDEGELGLSINIQGGRLGAEFSWGGLQKRLGLGYDPKRDNPILQEIAARKGRLERAISKEFTDWKELRGQDTVVSEEAIESGNRAPLQELTLTSSRTMAQVNSHPNWDDARQKVTLLRQVPLEEVLQALGLERDPYDPAKWKNDSHSISITQDKFYDWKSDRGGGGAIDLVMQVQDRGYQQAVAWLEERFMGGETATYPRHTQEELGPLIPDSSREESQFIPPLANEQNWQAVRIYLTETRQLPAEVVDRLHGLGLIYADDLHNAVFLRRTLGGEEIETTGATLRGTYQGSQFKGLAPGTRREAGYFSFEIAGATTFPADLPPRAVVCESPIDALSFAALDSSPQQTIYLSTDGAGAIPLEYLRQIPTVVAALDNDPQGKLMTEEIQRQLPWAIQVIPTYKDWNEDLQQQRIEEIQAYCLEILGSRDARPDPHHGNQFVIGGTMLVLRGDSSKLVVQQFVTGTKELKTLFHVERGKVGIDDLTQSDIQNIRETVEKLRQARESQRTQQRKSGGIEY